MIDVPVIIIGAGPTGLMSALCLAKLGIECIVIEKRQFPVATSNALAVQARTLEIWDQIGIAEQALSLGNPISCLKIFDGKKELAELSMKHLPTPYPFILGLPQSQTEKIMLKNLEKLPVKIYRQCEVVDIRQFKNHVEIQYNDPSKDLKVMRSKWLLGCDGAKSFVRKHCKISFKGKDLPFHFIMADIPYEKNQRKHHAAHSYLTPKGAIAVLPLKDFYRIIIDVSNVSSLKKVKAPELDIFERIYHERTTMPLEFAQPIWTSSFWIHERVVSTFRIDRIFLMGDAAHEHSPVGGQGMNTGIQDAFNLAWKIAMVERDYSSKKILNSYEDERKPIAQTVIKSTSHATRLLTSDIPGSKLILYMFIKLLSLSHRIQNRMLQAIANLKVNYAATKQTMENGFWRAGIKPGFRIPYRQVIFEGKATHLPRLIKLDKFTVLIFTGYENYSLPKIQSFIDEVQSYYLKKVRCIVINYSEYNLNTKDVIDDKNGDLHVVYGVKTTAFYCIRPDQYVGMRCKNLKIECLSDYFENVGFTL